MRPMYINLGWVKNVYKIVLFFKEAITHAERATTAIVDAVANEFGRNIIPIINASTKIGDIFSKKFSKDFLFSNPIKSKHPDAISQNLVGIKKYAAG